MVNGGDDDDDDDDVNPTDVESNVGFSLIPAEKVVQPPPKYYERACRNNG